jgi:hypothetical protein
MKRIRQSVLLSLGLILMACLLVGAAAGGHPDKKCYNTSGDLIPCNDSNFSQTQFAAKATARKSGPTAPAVVATRTSSPTASPSATPTLTAAPAATPMPTLIQAQGAVPQAAAAAQQTSPRPSPIILVILVLMLGFAGVLIVFLLFMFFRWLSRRGNAR